MTQRISTCLPEAPEPRVRGYRSSRPWLARAYGLKRSFTWLTDAGFAAAEERARNLPGAFARFTPEQLAQIRSCGYDGPWVLGRGAPMRKDLPQDGFPRAVRE